MVLELPGQATRTAALSATSYMPYSHKKALSYRHLFSACPFRVSFTSCSAAKVCYSCHFCSLYIFKFPCSSNRAELDAGYIQFFCPSQYYRTKRSLSAS